MRLSTRTSAKTADRSRGEKPADNQITSEENRLHPPSVYAAVRKKKPRAFVRPAVLFIKPLGVCDGGVALRRTRIG